MKEQPTRLTLIQKLQNECNEASWEEFINLYRGYVYVIIKNMGFSDNDSKDIMQMTFLKVWKNVQNFEHGGENGQFRRWLSRVSKNTALNYIRKLKNDKEKVEKIYIDKQLLHLNSITEPEIEKIADREWASYIANVAWDNIKENISDQLKTIFEFSMQGKTSREIAQILTLPINTVSVYKRRVKITLQKEILRLEDEFG